MPESIRKLIPHEEFDFQTLSHALKEYAHPRDKIKDLIRKKVIIRVKKGLYIFGEDYRRRPYSREILANLIYGPSYISLEYALQYYGLIPERVEAVTSVSSGRSRRFSTPVGIFTYKIVPTEAFTIGVDLLETTQGRTYLCALPEKALADKIRLDRGTGVQTQVEMRQYLAEDLRIDWQALIAMRPDRFEEYAGRYRSRKLELLAGLLRREKKSAGRNRNA